MQVLILPYVPLTPLASFPPFLIQHYFHRQLKGGYHYVQYKKPAFGEMGATAPKSKGYRSVTVLARVMWLWAGADWGARIK